MNEYRKGAALAAVLAASSIPLSYSYEPVKRPEIPLQPAPPERLTKAEKKRARKAAQRLKLQQRRVTP